MVQGLYAATSHDELRKIIEHYNRQDKAELLVSERRACNAFVEHHAIKPMDNKITQARLQHVKLQRRLKLLHKQKTSALHKRWHKQREEAAVDVLTKQLSMVSTNDADQTAVMKHSRGLQLRI